jgi:hypothetical protein
MQCAERMSLPAIPDHWPGIVFGLYCSPRLRRRAEVVPRYRARLGGTE